MPWTERYRPKKFEEIKGQEEIIKKVRRFFVLFPKKKAILLYGAPGTGKTTLAYVIASESNSEIFEINASDLRDKERLKEILRPAVEQKSLTKGGKVILVDEVDGILSSEKGGMLELLSLIDLSPHPVILTANDPWGKNLVSLRRKVEMVQLKEIDYRIIKNVLFNILKKENLLVNNDVITKIAVKSKGDLRAAINDLQTISGLEDASLIKFDERNKEVDIFNALRLIFKEIPTKDTLELFDSLNMSIDDIMLWIEENIPAEYAGKELAKAYDLLSKSDVFKGRIYKQQYWRFLLYENIFLSYGISASKDVAKRGFTVYKKPTRILKIWMNNQKTARRKTIAQKYASHVHIGEKRAMRDFPVLKTIIKSNPEIQKEIKLNEEEVEYLYQAE
ncbi:MAG TPA: replication factor C large subunit [Patescibacteria group bacterium]|nr:replication factor C large subunit [Patescibacteria group bacterium]